VTAVRALLVIGAGGHGKVVADIARAAGFSILGYIDRDARKLGTAVIAGGGSVLYDDDSVPPDFLDTGMLDGRPAGIALGIGDNQVRLAYADRFANCALPPLVHPRATASPEAQVSDGAAVMANAVINPGTRIGRAAVVNSGAIVEHDCLVGDGVHVSPGAVLNGAVTVNALAWIGAQAVVFPGVTIGGSSIVGAGAVVRRDVPPGVTVVGNPARVLRDARR
jgi:UDP-perosamine 4-acetyltransferase